MSAVDIGRLFAHLQSKMKADLQAVRRATDHPGTQGAAVEDGWVAFLSKYLPHRYNVARAFVLDAWGRKSEQIDLVVFDRQYSPFLFQESGVCYVPAESVYAIFEIKPAVNKSAVEYAGKKAASVRRLLRTSAPIPHAGGVFEPRRPFEIIAGLVADSSDWRPPFAGPFERALLNAVPAARLDIVCSLAGGGACAHYERSILRLETAKKTQSLVFFVLKLIELLQVRGTVPAMDIKEYARRLRISEVLVPLRKPVR